MRLPVSVVVGGGVLVVVRRTAAEAGVTSARAKAQKPVAARIRVSCLFISDEILCDQPGASTKKTHEKMHGDQTRDGSTANGHEWTRIQMVF